MVYTESSNKANFNLVKILQLIKPFKINNSQTIDSVNKPIWVKPLEFKE